MSVEAQYVLQRAGRWTARRLRFAQTLQLPIDRQRVSPVLTESKKNEREA